MTMKLTLISAMTSIALSSALSAQTLPGEALLLLDSDGNSSVSMQEFKNQMDTLFDGMDTNRNGRVERAEVESFMSDDIFDGADTNSDGSLSKSEFDTQTAKDFEAADKDGDKALD
jgi:hypothetical protein